MLHTEAWTVWLESLCMTTKAEEKNSRPKSCAFCPHKGDYIPETITLSVTLSTSITIRRSADLFQFLFDLKKKKNNLSLSLSPLIPRYFELVCGRQLQQK